MLFSGSEILGGGLSLHPLGLHLVVWLQVIKLAILPWTEEEAEGSSSGLRGSGAKEEGSETEEGDVEARYGLAGYEAEAEQRTGLSGVAVFASSKDDPYITHHVHLRGGMTLRQGL